MRINIIPVELLSDVHLKAEFREIIMSIYYYKRSSRTKNGIDDSKISKTYTLNKGHGYFWYNKFKYIENRYNELLNEMNKRGYKMPSIEEKFYDLYNEIIPDFRKNDYEPTKEEMYINIERILDRIYEMIYIKQKPNFYKYHKENLTFLDWSIKLTEKLELDTKIMHKMISDIEMKYV